MYAVQTALPVVMRAILMTSDPGDLVLDPTCGSGTTPYVVEATIPTPVDIDGDGTEDSGVPDDASYLDRMLEALRRSPILQLPGNKTISLKDVRPPGQSLMLSAEAGIEPDGAPAAIVFGPENGAISEKLVYEAAS